MAAPKNDKAGVKQTWDALNKAGYGIDVIDGAGERFKGLDKKEAVAEVTSCDDGYFVVLDTDGEQVGWVLFVFGNEPEEVICDHTTNLSYVLDPLTEKWGW